MKYWIAIGLFYILCANSANAQNEQLIKEIEQYILNVDTLIKSDLSDVDTLEITVYHGSIYLTNKPFLGIPYSYIEGGGGEWSYFKQDLINGNRFKWGDEILYEEVLKSKHKITKRQWYQHLKEYYRDEKIVAVKKEYGKTCWFPSKDADFKTMQITLYINDNNVVYYQKIGRVSRKDKKFLERKYDIKIH